MPTGLTPDLQRVVVDPNRVSRAHPGLSPVLLEDLARTPTVGERVVAVQPDDSGDVDFVGSAVVVVVDRRTGLAFLEVDWSSFQDEVKPALVPASARGTTSSRGRAYLRHLGGAANMPGHSGNTTRRGRVQVA